MQEQRWNGQDSLTDSVEVEHFLDAMLSGINRAVALHMPGSRIKHTDGREYEVDKNGCWRRVAEAE